MCNIINRAKYMLKKNVTKKVSDKYPQKNFEAHIYINYEIMKCPRCLVTTSPNTKSM